MGDSTSGVSLFVAGAILFGDQSWSVTFLVAGAIFSEVGLSLFVAWSVTFRYLVKLECHSWWQRAIFCEVGRSLFVPEVRK